MGVRVVSKFHKWNKGNPVGLSHVAEGMEELLQLLVEMFGLTISLGVVHSTEILVNIKEVTEGMSEVGCELSPMIQDNFAG